MCQAKPGLRCKQHGIEAIGKTTMKMEVARRELAAAATDARREALRTKLAKVTKDHETAVLEYEISVTGLNSIKNDILLKEENGEDANDLRQKYAERKELADSRRVAYRQLQRPASSKEQEEAKSIVENSRKNMNQLKLESQLKTGRLRKDLTNQINDGISSSNVSNLVKKIRHFDQLIKAAEEKAHEQSYARQRSVAYTSGCGIRVGC